MLKRTAAAAAAALVLALGGTGAALAANGADDPPGTITRSTTATTTASTPPRPPSRREARRAGRRPRRPEPLSPEGGGYSDQRSGSRTPSPPSGFCPPTAMTSRPSGPASNAAHHLRRHPHHVELAQLDHLVVEPDPPGPGDDHVGLLLLFVVVPVRGLHVRTQPQQA